MIVVIGDIHGEFWALDALLDRIPANAKVIQLGDFGIWPRKRPEWNGVRPVYFIDGNHDHIPSLPIRASAPVEVWPNAFYVPRGVVLELDSKRILFCGGSKSLDRAWREKDSEWHGWFEDEQLSDDDVERALTNANGGVDFMVTHTPPDSVIRRNFHPNGLRSFGHDPATWVDESARNVERLWNAVGQPPLYCGHMHRSVVDGNVRILNINEAQTIALRKDGLEK